MPRYAAFFGSINVGGNRVAMADLRHALEREDIENVETVVASGNVLFDYDDRPTEGLEDLFSWIMADRFDIKSFVAVRTRDELAAAVTGNPFAADGAENLVHTQFLGGQPDADAFDLLIREYNARGPERMALGDRALYIDYVDGAGNSRLTGDFIARRLGFPGTARNLRSMRRILEKMDA
ncbi:MAG: DUF1697 domain-containing protein [Novosphingobium sp.]